MGGVLRERSKRFELEEDRESVAEETEVGSWRSIPRLGTVGGSKSSPKVVQRVTTRKVRDIAAASEGWPVPSWCMWQKAAELPPWHRVVRVRCPIANNLCSHDRWERPAGWIVRSVLWFPFCPLTLPLLLATLSPPLTLLVSFVALEITVTGNSRLLGDAIGPGKFWLPLRTRWYRLDVWWRSDFPWPGRWRLSWVSESVEDERYPSLFCLLFSLVCSLDLFGPDQLLHFFQAFYVSGKYWRNLLSIFILRDSWYMKSSLVFTMSCLS